MLSNKIIIHNLATVHSAVLTKCHHNDKILVVDAFNSCWQPCSEELRIILRTAVTNSETINML